MHSTHEIIADIKAGRMVILMDDEDRENEGDLVVAAEMITPEQINFMAQHARGLICMPMTMQKCEQLKLPLMVRDKNQSRYGTNFTVSIEAATGVTTGISVHDRAHTVKVAASKDAKPEDIAQPGHIFPIMAQPGGVLVRAGHTEASCDLAMLAGLQPSAVICEILNEDGTMARRAQLEAFAQTHQLKIGTIEDLIRYRLEREPTIERLAGQSLQTQWGTFELSAFESVHDGHQHLALTMGEPKSPAMVRIQAYDPLNDLPGLSAHLSAGGRWPLHQAMQAIAEEGHGAIVMLGYPKGQWLDSLRPSNNKANSHSGAAASGQDWRDIGIGSQILNQLGYSKLKLLGAPKKFHGLSGFGLEVVEYLPYTERQN